MFTEHEKTAHSMDPIPPDTPIKVNAEREKSLLAVLCGEAQPRLLSVIFIQSLNRYRGVLRGRRRASHVGV